MATIVAQTTYALAAAWDFDVPPSSADLSLTVGLADATASHALTVTWEGSEEGERSVELGKAGDTLVLPLHGINHVRIEAAAYPTTILYGQLRTGARLTTGITRTA